MNLKLLSAMLTTLTLSTSVLPAVAGEHPPWISQDALAKDHRAYCDDVIGQQARTNKEASNQNDIGSETDAGKNSSMSEFKNSTQSGKKFGVSLPIVGGINFGEQSSEGNSGRTATSSETQFGMTWDKSRQHTSDHSTVTSERVGSNCSTFVQGAAMVESTQINAETDRMKIRAQEQLGMLDMFMSPRRR